jgi:hypothetical protein
MNILSKCVVLYVEADILDCNALNMEAVDIFLRNIGVY